MAILKGLMHDLEEHAKSGQGGFIEWSKHHKHENPDFSPVFKGVVATLARYFDVEVYATRLNFYADGSAWKPWHHDSHAGRAFFENGGEGPREDFTMGASFGESRELAFLHVESQAQFSFPQHNGDVFAFDARVNAQFQHGVPREVTRMRCGPRFSIIAWGRRVRLTERNGAAPEEVGTRDEVGKLKFPPGYERYLAYGYKEKHKENRVNAAGPDVAVVSQRVDEFVEDKAKKAEKAAQSTGKGGKKRNARIQPGAKK